MNIKKIIAILVLSLGLNPVFASDFTQYCAQKTADSTFLGNINSMTGLNFIARNILESQISRAFKKETNSKFKVNLDGFFGTSILNGEFKSFKANSSDFNYDGLAASSVNIETVCPYNKVGFSGGKLVLKENMVLKYQTEINQNDLNKIANSVKYLKIIEKINSDKAISSLIKITSSNIKLENNKLILNYSIAPKGLLSYLSISSNPVNLSFSTGLKAENGELRLCNFGLNSKKLGLDSLLPLINKFNPLTYGIKIGQLAKGTVEIQNVSLADSKIKLDGMVLLPKN